MRARNTAKLSAKFEISIPKPVREPHRWRAGQVFAFIHKGECLLLVPIPTVEQLSGVARGARKTGYRDRTERI